MDAHTTTFDLQIKDAATGGCTHLSVAPSLKVAALKLRLLRDGVAPANTQKVHLAHNGRCLQDAETLEAAGLVLVPTVVLVCVGPAPTPASPATPPQPPPSVLATAAARVTNPPVTTHAATPAAARPRTAIDRVWDQAFPSQPAAAAAPAPEEEVEEEKMCRVCFCGEEAGRLFAPCHCRGSMRWVHPECLNEWRATSVNQRSFYRCGRRRCHPERVHSPFASLTAPTPLPLPQV